MAVRVQHDTLHGDAAGELESIRAGHELLLRLGVSLVTHVDNNKRLRKIIWMSCPDAQPRDGFVCEPVHAPAALRVSRGYFLGYVEDLRRIG